MHSGFFDGQLFSGNSGVAPVVPGPAAETHWTQLPWFRKSIIAVPGPHVGTCAVQAPTSKKFHALSAVSRTHWTQFPDCGSQRGLAGKRAHCESDEHSVQIPSLQVGVIVPQRLSSELVHWKHARSPLNQTVGSSSCSGLTFSQNG